MAKKKGGRQFYANKHNGFYLSPKKKDNDKEEMTSDTTNSMAKGVSMRNSNAAHRTCQ